MTDENRRRLGSTSLGAIVAANMIGAGVFTTSGFALADLGSTRWVMLAWLLGGAMAVLGAICYGALAARISESGGEYVFLSRSLHPGVGFLAGWVSIWAGFTGAIALAAQAAQAYVAPWVPKSIPLDVLGSVAIVGAGLLHSRGVSKGTLVQNAIVVTKVAMLLVLIGVGAANLPARPAPTQVPFDLGAFTVTMMWVSLSYSGWNAAVYVAGEARDPERTLPRSMLVGTLAVTALYLALNWIFLGAAPVQELAGQEDVAAIAARSLGGAPLEALVRVVLVVALLTSISSMVMIGPRVMAKMSEDGLLPRGLSFSGKAPTTAIWTQVVLAVAMLWASGLREQLTNLGWILSLCTALSVVGLLRLRAREGAERVPIPGYPFLPFAFLILVFGLTLTMALVSGAQLIPAGTVLATGALAFVMSQASQRR